MTGTTGKKIFNRVYEVLSTVIIVCGVIALVMYLLGIRLYHVKSGSMGELLPVGCVCFVDTHYDYSKIKAGDVISFSVDEDMFVTHRAVRLTDEGIYTRGDENDSEDPDPVTEDNYIGRIVFALPYLGFALAWLHTMPGLIAAGAVVCALFVTGLFYRKKE